MENQNLWHKMPQMIVDHNDELNFLNALPDDKLETHFEKFINEKFTTEVIVLIEGESLDTEKLNQVYNFLLRNYNNSGRLLIYTKDILSYYFKVYKTNILILKDKSSNTIVGLIVGSLRNIFVKNKSNCLDLSTWYINFLCIHKDYRKNNLAATLILKIWFYLNKINRGGVAMFHNEESLNVPCSFSQTIQYIQPLNIQRLIQSKQIELPTNLSEKENFQRMLINRYNAFSNIEKTRSKIVLLAKNDKNDIDTILDCIHKYRMKNFDIFFVPLSSEIEIRIGNSDFICIKCVYDSELVGYIDVFKLKESNKNLFTIGKIDNYYFKDGLSLNKKDNFIDLVIERLYNIGVDVVEFPEHLVLSSDYLKNKCVKNGKYDLHLFNHSIYQIDSKRNGIHGF